MVQPAQRLTYILGLFVVLIDDSQFPDCIAWPRPTFFLPLSPFWLSMSIYNNMFSLLEWGKAIYTSDHFIYSLYIIFPWIFLSTRLLDEEHWAFVKEVLNVGSSHKRTYDIIVFKMLSCLRDKPACARVDQNPFYEENSIYAWFSDITRKNCILLCYYLRGHVFCVTLYENAKEHFHVVFYFGGIWPAHNFPIEKTHTQ